MDPVDRNQGPGGKDHSSWYFHGRSHRHDDSRRKSGACGRLY